MRPVGEGPGLGGCLLASQAISVPSITFIKVIWKVSDLTWLRTQVC